MVVVGLAMINGVSGSIELLTASLVSQNSVCSFTPISSIVFLVFVLLYSPCISAISMIKNELGRTSALYVFVFQFLLAFFVSFLVYRTLLDFNMFFVGLAIVVLDIVLSFVLKLVHKKNKCRGNCNACGKICCR
jgi:ferrous iron transport protein B